MSSQQSHTMAPSRVNLSMVRASLFWCLIAYVSLCLVQEVYCSELTVSVAKGTALPQSPTWCPLPKSSPPTNPCWATEQRDGPSPSSQTCTDGATAGPRGHTRAEPHKAPSASPTASHAVPESFSIRPVAGEFRETLAGRNRWAILSQAAPHGAEGAETNGGKTDSLNDRHERPPSISDEEIVQAHGKPGEPR